MAIYITQTKGLIGSPILQRQEYLVNAARQQGILPLSLYYYPVDGDSLGELSARQDGILSGVSFGDDIIVQLPTLLGEKYELSLINKVNSFRSASTSKLIIVVSQLPTLDKSEEVAENIKLYNQADVLIVPSVESGTFLREHGLQVSRLVYLDIWDRNINLALDRSTFKRKIVTPNENLAKKITGEWVRPTSTLVYDLHMAGGYGLLWPSTKYESGILEERILASGLPIIVNNESYLARLVERAGMGISFNDLMTVTDYVKHSSPEDYQTLAANAGRFSAFLREGGFTSHAISQAVAQINQLK